MRNRNYIIAFCLSALATSACGVVQTPEHSSRDQPAIPTLSAEEATAYRASRLEEMEAYVGDIVPERDNAHSAPYRTETIEIEIENLGEVEYSFWIEEDQGLVYSWKVLGETDNGGVYFDLHGHPGKENRDQFADGFFETYSTGVQSAGSGIVDPGITGYHGWFFLNLEDRPITIELTVSGFYERHLEIYRSVAGVTRTKVDY